MKRWTVKEIGGIEFEFDTKNRAIYSAGESPSYSDIFEAYGRPSAIKQGIWKSWVDWFKKHSEDFTDWLQIASHNANFFTIEGQITIGHTRYHLYITKCHNRAWEVV